LSDATADSQNTSASSEVVYGVDLIGNLIFIPTERARELREFYRIWSTVTTWGELMERLQEAGLTDELELFEDREEHLIADKPITDEDKSAYFDMELLPWAGEEMLDWMPNDVLEMGSDSGSPGGTYGLYLRPEQEAEVVAALEANGYTCTRDDELILAAGLT
jgi:hypothetical protein